MPPGRHAFGSTSSYSSNVMRGAFVVRLGQGTKPDQGLFEGWVEEVDSGKELRFHSTAELVKFLGERFYTAFSSPSKEVVTGLKRASEEGES